MEKVETATFGGGCFWCTEAVFQRLKGVQSVVSGYAGGHVVNPSYSQTFSEDTGHAEAVQIMFDPTVISYEKLLDVFWVIHDPTTLNRQGGDIGPNYRSVIYYHNEEQKRWALASKEKMDKTHKYQNPIVTEISPFLNFYKAEDYHQNYYNKNRDVNPYCSIVIDPKIEKLLKEFNEDVKDEFKTSVA